jgi:diguanylate cyclase (GGDEF)-like protein/PAS domain S-box-containing protein
MYRGQRRYEASVVAMGNQARAINAHVMTSETTPDGCIVRVNEAFERALGYEQGELLGKNHRMFNSGVHPAAYYERLWSTVLSGRIWTGVFRNRRKDGRLIWLNATIIPYLDDWGRVERFVAFYNDVTESVTLSREVKEERRQREHLARINRSLLTAAHTDPLTGLANRRGFDSFVEQALAATGSAARPLSVMMLDLDHFKRVNDTHGHAAGDAVLKEMARRWSRQIRDSDLLARLGGEEFCVVLPGTALQDATAVAEKLRRVTASDPVAMVSDEGQPLSLPVTVSIGVAAVDVSLGLDFPSLLHAADEAVYEAKHAGRDRVVGRSHLTG